MFNSLRWLVRYFLLKLLSFFIKGNGVLLRKRHKKQWVYSKDGLMGGQVNRPIYFPNGIDPKWLGTMESQAITEQDFWTCVSNSFCRVVQIILEYLITIDADLKKGLDDLGFIDENGHVNISQRALAVMSGTVPGRGNSQYKVAETARVYGLVSEKFCPTLPGMTEIQFFTLPTGTYAQAKKFLDLIGIFHEDTDEITKEVFTHGGLQVCVAAPYETNNNVVQPKSSYAYNHSVCDYGLADYNKICDSYDPFLKDFALNYKLGTPKIIYVQKKNPILKYPLIQKDGGIYALAKAGVISGKYYGFETGNEYKAENGEYNQVKKVKVAMLPANMARDNDGNIIKIAFIIDFNKNGQSSGYIPPIINP